MNDNRIPSVPAPQGAPITGTPTIPTGPNPSLPVTVVPRPDTRVNVPLRPQPPARR